MKICPKCGKVISYNSYFGGYICSTCKWEDTSIGKIRNTGSKTYYRLNKTSCAIKSSNKVIISSFK